MHDVFRRLRFVKDGIVHDKRHAFADGRKQAFFKPSVEHRRVGRAGKQHGRGEFAFYQCADERGAWPAVAGTQTIDTLSSRRSAVRAHRREIKAGFIEIDQRVTPSGNNALRPLFQIPPPIGHMARCFIVPPRLFFRGRPSRLHAFQIATSLTPNSLAYSFNMRSGFFSMALRNAS